MFFGLAGSVGVGSGFLFLGIAAGLSAAGAALWAPRDSTAAVIFRRVAAGALLGVIILASGLARLHSPRTGFSSAIDPSMVAILEGRARHDLRPGSSPYRVMELEVDSVQDSRGWRSSARGRITLIWQGEEYLRSESTRIIPVRGDRIVVERMRGIDGSLVFSDSEALRIHPSRGLPAIRRTIRNWIRARLGRLDRRGGAMMPALLLGDRASLSRELSRAVRASGASHVLALSGMHLGVLAVILHRGPARFFPKRLRALAVLPFLCLYVWIAGWIPSLVRALVLIALVSLSQARSRAVPTPLQLARTVCVIGVLSPWIAANIGFQLSIFALVGIVILSPLLVDTLAPYLSRPVAVYIGVTIAAMVSTAPLSLSAFGSVYPAGVVLAGLLSFLIVIQMWLGILFLVVATIPVAGTVVGHGIRLNTIVIEETARAGYFFPVLGATGAVYGFLAVGAVLGTAIALRWRIVLRSSRESRLDF